MSAVATFRFVGSGKYAGAAIVVNHDGLRTVSHCPHRHSTMRLAITCAATTLIPTSEEDS